MESSIPIEERISFMQQYLRENRLNHDFDDWADAWNCPLEQVLVRDFYELLKERNCLPNDVPWIQEELKRENENHT